MCRVTIFALLSLLLLLLLHPKYKININNNNKKKLVQLSRFHITLLLFCALFFILLLRHYFSFCRLANKLYFFLKYIIQLLYFGSPQLDFKFCVGWQ
jgi:hypothetical protein